MSLVTVAITGYNISEYVETAIDSILNQTYKNLEIVFVDDGSKDDTFRKACQLLQAYSKRVLVAQYNKAAGGARNTAINVSTGKYIVFLDGDDWLAPGAVQDLVATAAKKPVQAVFSDRNTYYDKTGVSKPSILFKERVGVDIKKIPYIKKRIAIHGKLFDRKFLVDNNVFFPENMSVEDFVFSYDFLAKASSVSTLPVATYFYRKRQGGNKSLTQDRLTEFSLTSRFKQIEMTQKIAATEGFKEKYPNVNEMKTNFQHRLMRHIVCLPKEQNVDLKDNAFALIKKFVSKNEEDIFQNVSAGCAEVYSEILCASQKVALIAIDNYVKKRIQTSKPLLNSLPKSKVGVINLFYWDKKKNFGDKIGPFLVKQASGRLVQNVFQQPDEDHGLLVVGSIIGMLDRPGLDIWGSGLIRPLSKSKAAELAKFEPRMILAVRGYKTYSELRQKLGWDVPRVFGDPALLLPNYLSKNKNKSKTLGKVCMVPHYSHASLFSHLPESENLSVLSVKDDPLSVVNDIATSKVCISTSLHGIIVAHAYGVPWVWLRIADKVLVGDAFKFEDFFTVLNAGAVATCDVKEEQALLLSELEILKLAEKANLPKNKFDFTDLDDALKNYINS
ncbi:glycosyltransferase [Vreelandella profundi]|uniref:glycosyltransferase n=1 Tax=Vreelandella profundi TaxID=2852117 RepID=UPI001EF15E46|nr:glycosyltransferase [Halomonas profundi]